MAQAERRKPFQSREKEVKRRDEESAPTARETRAMKVSLALEHEWKPQSMSRKECA